MTTRPQRRIALWLLAVAASTWMVVHAHYVADLSAFLPAKPTPLQQLLVDQLRDGPASRLILIALEGGDPATRGEVARAMVAKLRNQPQFAAVEDGDAATVGRDREFLFQHRYVLSPAITAAHFSVTGLRQAISDTIDDLAGSTGLLMKALVPHDPTGEMSRIVDRLAVGGAPRVEHGVWASADGRRTLLVAQTAAAGSDTDAQARALEAISRAFQPAPPGVRLRLTGPGVFAVAAREQIKHAASRLAIISSLGVIALLLWVYRSTTALILGLLPVATGALAGIAAVQLAWGMVHGTTLGFGITLIGEAVDYSVYFFVQSAGRGAAVATQQWQRALWPTVRLGMLTSVCGFASLLPSGFPGLAQLGLYSIAGLLAAALVTRFVLPELTPRTLQVRDLDPLGNRLHAGLARLQRGPAVGVIAVLLAVLAAGVLYQHRQTLWNHELSALSPISPADLAFDATLRSDLGTANVLDLIVVTGPTEEAVLAGAERAAPVLQELTAAGVIGGFDSPAIFLPSLASQRARLAALPDRAVLSARLQAAVADLDLDAGQLAPFLDDVDRARSGAPLAAADLDGTSLAVGYAALILRHPGHFTALLPLHANSASVTPDLDVARIAAAVSSARLANTQVLDLKVQTDALYASYLEEALRLSGIGLLLIIVLLRFVLRSVRRVARVLAPLLLAVLAVAAGLALLGVRLNILHLVGMLLIFAVGSNYALFFDTAQITPGDAHPPRLLASLGVANVSTVIGFGLLAFSAVPVLQALGATVAPGAFLALLFAGLLCRPRSLRPRSGPELTHA